MEGLLYFLLGVFASAVIAIVAWFYPLKVLVPKLEFSDEMAEYELPGGQSFFQCAFRNIGKRPMIDTTIIVRIGIKNYMNASSWAYHTFETNGQNIPVLHKSERRKVRVFDTREGPLFVEKPSLSLRTAIEKSRSLRDILKLGSDATVVVHVFGYDELSGSRKHFQSKHYRISDIRIGTFDDGLNVVKNNRFASSQEKPCRGDKIRLINQSWF